MGLRYDYAGMACPPIKNPDTLLASFNIDTGTCPKDKNNFAPRFGLSYAFNERTVLRAGFGIFYNRTPAIVVGTAHSQNGIQVTGINITCATPPPESHVRRIRRSFRRRRQASPANPKPVCVRARLRTNRTLSREGSASSASYRKSQSSQRRTFIITGCTSRGLVTLTYRRPRLSLETGPDGITYTSCGSPAPSDDAGAADRTAIQPDQYLRKRVTLASTTVLHSR
jgi:hypothetical protein